MYLISIKKYRGRFINLLRFITCFAICLVVLFSAGGTSADAATDVKLTVETGFDGKCKLGGFNPVLVRVETGGSGHSGLLKVNAGERRYSCKVELGNGSRKEVRFAVPFFKANEQVEAVFESEGKVLAEAIHTPVILSERTVLIGIISDTPQHLYYLSEMDLGGGKVEVVSLDRDLAYNLEELDNLNLIVIEDLRRADLGEQEIKLLEEWVGLGNCMLFGTGAGLPQKMAGVVQDLDRPARVGEGIIVPVAEGVWEQSPHLVEELILKNITPYAINKAVNGSRLQEQIKAAGNLNGVADYTLRPNKSIIYFLLSLLILYLIAATAAAFSTKQRRWGYAAVVGLFCLIFMGISTTSGIFKAAAAGAAVKVHGATTRTSALTCVYPYNEDGVRVKMPAASFASVLDGGGWEVDPLTGELNCSGKNGQYIYAGSLEMTGTEDMALTIDRDGILSGEIKNPLPDRLKNCFLIIGDTVIPVGDLAGKEKISLNYQLDHNLRGSGDYNYLAALYRAAGIEGCQRQLLDYYFYNIDDWKMGGKLLGYGSETGDLEINGRKQKVNYTVLNLFNIDIKETSGELFLPAETIRPVIDYGQTGTGDEGIDKREYISEEGSEIKVFYVIPPEIEPLNVIFSELPDSGVWVFNCHNKTWEDFNENMLAGEKLQSYLSTGPLVLKISGTARGVIPQIAVKGVVE